MYGRLYLYGCEVHHITVPTPNNVLDAHVAGWEALFLMIPDHWIQRKQVGFH